MTPQDHQLLVDFLSNLSLRELAARHNLLLPDLIAWADRPDIVEALADIIRISDLRTQLLAATNSTQALTTLSELAAVPAAPSPPVLRSRESTRKACAAILRHTPKPRSKLAHQPRAADPSLTDPTPTQSNPTRSTPAKQTIVRTTLARPTSAQPTAPDTLVSLPKSPNPVTTSTTLPPRNATPLPIRNSTATSRLQAAAGHILSDLALSPPRPPRSSAPSAYCLSAPSHADFP